jgi:hypothetical protein
MNTGVDFQRRVSADFAAVSQGLKMGPIKQ